MIKNIIFIFLLCLSFMAKAQPAEPAMADGMRTDGKIWVVIGVIAIVFAAIVVLLVMLERRIKKLEDKTKK